MNKEVREHIKLDACFLGNALAAATAIAVSPTIPLGRKERKACFAVVVSSANLNNDANFDFGIVDDSIAAIAATTNLATANAAGDTLAYQRTGVGGLVADCNSMAVDVTAAADGAITINGTVFPYAAVPATALEWSTDAELVAAINGAGLGLTATAEGANVVGIASTIPGETTITFAETVTAVIATDIIIRAFSVLMEVDASAMAAGATGIIAVVDYLAGTGAATVHGVVAKGNVRYTPEQAVAISI